MLVGFFFIASCGSVPSAIPSSPLRGPHPPRKRWGAREYINAHHPRPASGGGQVNVVAEWLFFHNLALHSLPGEGGPCFLKTCLPHLGGRGTTVVVEGGLLKMINGELKMVNEGWRPLKIGGAIFIASCGSVPSAIPSSPLRGPHPPRKRWGAREYINAHHPRPASGGGQVNVVAEWLFFHNLALHSLPGERDHASLKLACPIYGEGGPRSGGRGSLHRRRSGSNFTYRKNFMCRL